MTEKMIWYALNERAAQLLGYIPSFLSEEDPRPAREQFQERYIAGWSPFQGFEMGKECELIYPGDPPLRPIATATLRDEIILVYEYAWVAILQKKGNSFEVCRMD